MTRTFSSGSPTTGRGFSLHPGLDRSIPSPEHGAGTRTLTFRHVPDMDAPSDFPLGPAKALLTLVVLVVVLGYLIWDARKNRPE